MKSLRIFLLVLIIIGVGLLGTQSIWVPKLVNRIIANEFPAPATVVFNKPVSTLGGTTITSDWKTYSDIEHKLQFKYPSFEILDIDNSDATTTYLQFREFGFGISKKLKNETLDEWLVRNVDRAGILSRSGFYKKSDFKGNPAFVMTDKEIPPEYSDGPISTSFYTESPTKDYVLSFGIYGQDSPPGASIRNLYNTPDVFQRFQDDILSTLIFLDSKDWVTYRSTQGRFTFRHPSNWLLREDSLNPGWVSVTPTSPLPPATEVTEVSFKIVPFNPATPYESLESDALSLGLLDARRDCVEITLAERMAFRCSPVAINGLAYVVPIGNNKGISILDSVTLGQSMDIVNSLVVE